MIKTISININDFIILSKLTRGEFIILSQLLKLVSNNINYDGYIILNASIRKEIVDTLNISSATFNNAINSLCKKEFILREDTNMYKPNTEIFLLK